MRTAAAALGAMLTAAAGLLSIVSFTIAMLANGQLGWLIIGWFALPITIIVWPAILGATWTVWFYAALVVGVGLAAAGGLTRDSSY